MNIGILGAGVVGKNLGIALAKAGHALMLSSRDPQSDTMQALLSEIGGEASAGTAEETVAFGEVIIIAIGWQNGLGDLLTSISDWSDKVLIDTTNRFGGEHSRSAAEDISAMTGAPVLKAFNSIGAEFMSNPQIGDTVATLLVCGDEAAKAKALPIVEDTGFDVVDVGGIEFADAIESMARVWVQLAFTQGYGRDIAFKLVRK